MTGSCFSHVFHSKNINKLCLVQHGENSQGRFATHQVNNGVIVWEIQWIPLNSLSPGGNRQPGTPSVCEVILHHHKTGFTTLFLVGTGVEPWTPMKVLCSMGCSYLNLRGNSHFPEPLSLVLGSPCPPFRSPARTPIEISFMFEDDLVEVLLQQFVGEIDEELPRDLWRFWK